MKTTHPDPADERLSELLREARTTTAVPANFHDRVWRRIERVEAAEQDSARGWLATIAAMILRPRLAGALAAIIVLIGAGVGVVQGTVSAHQAAQDRYLASVAPSPVR